MLALLLLAACGQKTPPETSASGTPAPGACTLSSCLPEGLQDLPFGTPMAEFQARFPELAPEEQGFYFREVYVRSFEGEDFEAAVYYFDVDLPEQPLYEVIVAYPRGTDPTDRAVALLGPPNDGEEWVLPLEGEDAPLQAWRFEYKLVFAVPWLGTEWNDPEVEGDGE